MLQSQLFRGDRALQACLVNDKAHLVEGTRGPHVRKVQEALALIDGALIALDEFAAERYGPTTAKAVLSFKRARKVINFSYQKTADNIVGKMTIAALDKEMARREGRQSVGGCQDETRRGGTRSIRENTTQSFTAAPLAGARARLRVSFQDALNVNEIGLSTPLRTFLLSRKANKLLAPFGLALLTSDLGSFPFPRVIGERDLTDVEGIRKAAQKANAGSEDTLRVIYAHFRPTTSTAVSHGAVTLIEGFQNFVLINKQKIHPDFGTLLHEMIHCSSARLMGEVGVHVRDDDTHIMSAGVNRTFVPRDQVDALRTSFFA